MLMKISLTKAGKRYNRDWIFRNVSFEFVTGTAYAITGPNGSGKSTLLQAIGGAIALTEGTVSFHKDTSPVPEEDHHETLAIAAPYLELIEELSVTEFLHFHEQFKKFLPGFTAVDVIHRVGLDKAANKQIRYYSSGMKQRVKLAQAIFSDVPLVLLDEPCTNLDKEGIALYQSLISEFCTGRLVIVSSNDPVEYGFCTGSLNIMDYKQ